MLEVNTSNIVSAQTVQKARVNRAIDRIANDLKEQHSKIEDILSRLTECLASVQIVEWSVGVTKNKDAITELRTTIECAHLLSEDLSQKLKVLEARTAGSLLRSCR